MTQELPSPVETCCFRHLRNTTLLRERLSLELLLPDQMDVFRYVYSQ